MLRGNISHQEGGCEVGYAIRVPASGAISISSASASASAVAIPTQVPVTIPIPITIGTRTDKTTTTHPSIWAQAVSLRPPRPDALLPSPLHLLLHLVSPLLFPPIISQPGNLVEYFLARLGLFW